MNNCYSIRARYIRTGIGVSAGFAGASWIGGSGQLKEVVSVRSAKEN